MLLSIRSNATASFSSELQHSAWMQLMCEIDLRGTQRRSYSEDPGNFLCIQLSSGLWLHVTHEHKMGSNSDSAFRLSFLPYIRLKDWRHAHNIFYTKMHSDTSPLQRRKFNTNFKKNLVLTFTQHCLSFFIIYPV